MSWASRLNRMVYALLVLPSWFDNNGHQMPPFQIRNAIETNVDLCQVAYVIPRHRHERLGRASAHRATVVTKKRTSEKCNNNNRNTESDNNRKNDNNNNKNTENDNNKNNDNNNNKNNDNRNNDNNNNNRNNQQTVNAALLRLNLLVSFLWIPFPETLKLRIRRFFVGKRTLAERVIKCRKALWLHAREALWSNCKQTQSSESKLFCVRNMNCCFAHCGATTPTATITTIKGRGATTATKNGTDVQNSDR